MSRNLRAMLLSSFATLPRQGTPGAVGYDLFSALDCVVLMFRNFHCYTDVTLQFPTGSYGRIASRSGLASKGILVHAGVVDPDYTGNIFVLLYNNTDRPFYVYQGDRVTQLICERAIFARIEEVSEDRLTNRGALGFGSTG